MGCLHSKADQAQNEAPSHTGQIQIGNNNQTPPHLEQNAESDILNGHVESLASKGLAKGKAKEVLGLEPSTSTPSWNDGYFNYTSLQHGESIRLLILEPAKDPKTALKATLIHVRLGDNPKYEAISYTWGEPKFPQDLQFPTGRLNITENLSDALRRFRLEDAPRVLWADAVCINQKNDAEKGHQVGLMTKIYKRATSVLIWLGEETQDSERAIQTFLDVAESHGFSAIDDPIDEHWWRTTPVVKGHIKDRSDVVRRAKESCIQDIYAREWFERLWIVQEVALASKPVLHCGSKRLPWGPFAATMTFLAAADNALTPKLDEQECFKRAINIINICTHLGDINEIQPSLIVSNYHHWGIYMYKLRHQKCTDNRDRVYALLGLRPYWCELPGNDLLNIEADYSQSAFDVYRHWAGEMMGTGECNFMLDAGIYQRRVHITNGDMEFFNGDEKWKKGCWVKTEEDEIENKPSQILSLARVIKSGDPSPAARSIIIPRIQELPSWVPDLSNYAQSYNSVPWTNRRGLQGFQARSVAKFGDCLQFVKWESGDQVPRKIWVKALMLDKIGSTMGIHEWTEDVKCPRMTYLRSVIENCHFFFQKFGRRDGEPWPIDEDPETAFARTIFADGSGAFFQSRFNPADESQAYWKSQQIDPTQFLKFWKDYNTLWGAFDSLEGHFGSFDELPPNMQDVFGILTSFYACFSEVLEGHTFFLSNRRFIGLAPLVAKEGDQIALIDSLRTPVALRLVTTDNGEQGYILVGPCYVQGVMYGETQKNSGSKLAKEGEYIPLM